MQKEKPKKVQRLVSKLEYRRKSIDLYVNPLSYHSTNDSYSTYRIYREHDPIVTFLVVDLPLLNQDLLHVLSNRHE